MTAVDRLDARSAALDDLLAEWLTDEPAVPGASVAVVEGDELVYAKGFGARDLETNAPATPDTRYGVASCTKSVTAIAIMQRVEAGDLALDDPVTDHLPRDLCLGAPNETVTIHDLLTHSSGVPADGMAYVLLERNAGIASRDDPLSSWDDFYRLVADGQTEATDAPGVRYFYYNSGYTLLGQVVEHVAGTPFHEYVQDHVLDPLAMTRSTFDGDTYAADSDAATPYVLEDGALRPTRLPVDELFDPPGGLLSTARDLATYLRACLGEGCVGDTVLVSADSFDAMTTGHVPVDWRRDDPARYGYGWTVDDLLDHRLVGHEGNLGVSSAYLGFLPDADLGVAVLANAGLYSFDYELDAVGRAVLATLIGHDPRETAFFGTREKLDSLSGRYASIRGTLTVDVTRKDGHLRIESDGLPPLSGPLIPETSEPDDWRFYTVTASGGEKSVEFVADEDGVSLLFARWRLRRV